MREQKLSKRASKDQRGHVYFDRQLGEWVPVYNSDSQLIYDLCVELDKTHNRSNNFGGML